MEMIRFIDLCYAYKLLAKVKTPRAAAAALKLEEIICKTVEGMEMRTSVPVSIEQIAEEAARRRKAREAPTSAPGTAEYELAKLRGEA